MAVKQAAPRQGIAGTSVAVIGLGLMGGSVARALGRAGIAVTAWDRDETVLAQALEQGVIAHAAPDGAQAVAGAALVVLCLYPGDTLAFLQRHHGDFAPGAVVTDICGVKRCIDEQAQAYSRFHFVPGHPMAGRERGGFGQSTATLFDGCNYLLTPQRDGDAAALNLVRRFAGVLGTAWIIETTPEEHDAMIAYTSQLPHALAVAYVLAADGRDPLPFSAGSYRDVSRVAAINATMWSELFLRNADALQAEMDRLRAGMDALEDALRRGDRHALIHIMSQAATAREAQPSAGGAERNGSV